MNISVHFQKKGKAIKGFCESFKYQIILKQWERRRFVLLASHFTLLSTRWYMNQLFLCFRKLHVCFSDSVVVCFFSQWGWIKMKQFNNVPFLGRQFEKMKGEIKSCLWDSADAKCRGEGRLFHKRRHDWLSENIWRPSPDLPFLVLFTFCLSPPFLPLSFRLSGS